MAVADDLDFRLVRDRLEVWVEDAAFGVEGLAVAVAGGGGGVEAVGELILGFGGARGLVLEDHNIGFVECVADQGEVIVCEVALLVCCFELLSRFQGTYSRGYRSTECSLRSCRILYSTTT